MLDKLECALDLIGILAHDAAGGILHEGPDPDDTEILQFWIIERGSRPSFKLVVGSRVLPKVRL